jgi:hypothetical protein
MKLCNKESARVSDQVKVSPCFSTDASNAPYASELGDLKSADGSKPSSVVRASFCIKGAPQVRPTLLLIDKTKTTIDQIKQELH